MGILVQTDMALGIHVCRLIAMHTERYFFERNIKLRNRFIAISVMFLFHRYRSEMIVFDNFILLSLMMNLLQYLGVVSLNLFNRNFFLKLKL